MHRPGSVVALAALVLSGCGTAVDEPDEPAYSPPGWMADVLAQDEEYVSAMSTCLEDRGQSVLAHAGTVGIRPPSAEGGEPLPGASELADQAWDECSTLVPAQTYLSDDRELEFDRMLDVIECLEHEGYPLPAPPSREAWVSGSAEYSPYAELTEPPDGAGWGIEVDEVLRVLEICPTTSQKFVVLDPEGQG
jgi:hypothetical protein